MNIVELPVEARDVQGKQVRGLRRQGITPVHIYGGGLSPFLGQVDTRVLERIIARASQTVPVQVVAGGDQHFTFIREIQRHPVTDRLIHVDFLRVDITQTMSGQVPVVLAGEAPAVRLHGGLVNLNMAFVSVECLPTDLPSEIQVDISALHEIGDAIYLRDVATPPKVTLTGDPASLVLRINAPRKALAEEDALAVDAPALIGDAAGSGAPVAAEEEGSAQEES